MTSIQRELAATNRVDQHGASARAINATLEQRPPCRRMFTSPSSIVQRLADDIVFKLMRNLFTSSIVMLANFILLFLLTLQNKLTSAKASDKALWYDKRDRRSFRKWFCVIYRLQHGYLNTTKALLWVVRRVNIRCSTINARIVSTSTQSSSTCPQLCCSSCHQNF